MMRFREITPQQRQKWQRLCVGERVMLSDQDLDMIFATYANDPRIGELVTEEGPSYLGSRNRYLAYLRPSTEAGNDC